jgi:ubiquinone/menaquinone biosynthesis C-methylase UbiE
MVFGASERNLGEYLESYNSLPFEIYQETFRRNALIEFLNSEKFGVATEIGCGRASIFEFWTPLRKSQTVEPISAFLDQAKNRVKQPEIWIGLHARAEDVSPIKDLEKSDVTILSSILHEVEDSSKFLKACIEITKPGGVVVVIVTNKDSIHRILGVRLGYQESLNHKTSTEIQMQQSHGAYSMNELTDELNRNGLNVISISSFFPKLFSHQQMSDFLKNSIISLDFLESMDALSNSLPGLGSEIIAVARVPND